MLSSQCIFIYDKIFIFSLISFDIFNLDDFVGCEIKTQVKGHGGGVRAVAWPPDGSLIVSTGFDGFVRLLDAETG